MTDFIDYEIFDLKYLSNSKENKTKLKLYKDSNFMDNISRKIYSRGLLFFARKAHMFDKKINLWYNIVVFKGG